MIKNFLSYAWSNETIFQFKSKCKLQIYNYHKYSENVSKFCWVRNLVDQLSFLSIERNSDTMLNLVNIHLRRMSLRGKHKTGSVGDKKTFNFCSDSFEEQSITTGFHYLFTCF